MMDTVLKNEYGISYTQDLQIFVVVYGVVEDHNNVSSVGDKISTVTNGVINFNEKVKMDVVDPFNNQNPVSKKIHDDDINRVNNPITNRSKYCHNNNLAHNNEKTVKLKDFFPANKVTSDASHFASKSGGEFVIQETVLHYKIG